jgi:arsenate reductase (glutaredoxin)
MSVTIYHNPSCGTSRNTLAMIRQSGEEPEVIEYLKNTPSRARLVELIRAMGISVRALLREKDTPYGELGLADPKWSDDQLLDFMLAHPILINPRSTPTSARTRSWQENTSAIWRAKNGLSDGDCSVPAATRIEVAGALLLVTVFRRCV